MDLSYAAFGLIADHDKGVINVMFERLPFCSAAGHGVNTQTCDKYNGVVHLSDLWKLGVGVAACFAVAGLSVGSLVKLLYRT